MAASAGQITRERLWRKIGRGDPFVLVDALSPMSFAASHLPGAINMPPARVDELAPQRIPGRETEVVVYCTSPACESSVDVAIRLIELGYRNVLRYAEGKTDWLEAGLPLEGGRA